MKIIMIPLLHLPYSQKIETLKKYAFQMFANIMKFISKILIIYFVAIGNFVNFHVFSIKIFKNIIVKFIKNLKIFYLKCVIKSIKRYLLYL